jgi:ACR3 family arsenite transporter
MSTSRANTATPPNAGGQLNFFERYLTLWVLLCIGVGIALGRLLPGVAIALDAMSIYQVSVPIAICLFFMMYPIMVKIDFAQAKRAGPNPSPRAAHPGGELADQAVYHGAVCPGVFG